MAKIQMEGLLLDREDILLITGCIGITGCLLIERPDLAMDMVKHMNKKYEEEGMKQMLMFLGARFAEALGIDIGEDDGD